MAAGMGVRFGGLKQLTPVGPDGEVFFDYSASDALAAGFDRVVFVVRSEIEDQMRAHVRESWPSSVPVEFVLQDKDPRNAGLERTKPLGTAHAVLATRPVVPGDFAVINADDLYGPHGYRLLAAHLTGSPPTEHSLVGFQLADTVPDTGEPVMRGISATDGSGLLVSITETEVRRGDPDVLVSMNMWGFHPSIFDHLETAVDEFVNSSAASSKAEVLLPTVIGGLVSRNEIAVRVLPGTDRWVGLTYSADLDTARRAVADLVSSGTEPAALWG
jgi:NDP-sugar pyrophosphorylase family protein